MSVELHWTQWLLGIHWTPVQAAKLIQQHRLFVCLGPISVQFKIRDYR